MGDIQFGTVVCSFIKHDTMRQCINRTTAGVCILRRKRACLLLPNRDIQIVSSQFCTNYFHPSFDPVCKRPEFSGIQGTATLKVCVCFMNRSSFYYETRFKAKSVIFSIRYAPRWVAWYWSISRKFGFLPIFSLCSEILLPLYLKSMKKNGVNFGRIIKHDQLQDWLELSHDDVCWSLYESIKFWLCSCGHWFSWMEI